MNLLAATTDNKEAFGEAFNVAVGGRNTLNELYKLMKEELNRALITNYFRAGYIRHSNADISKAKRTLGYAPTHDIYQGMAEAIEWYMEIIREVKQSNQKTYI